MEAIVGIVERSMYRQFLAVWKGEVLFGDSVQSLATYYRYTHAISYERLSRLFGEVYQNEDVCVHVIRPSRGQQVIHEVMNGHRP